MFDLFKGFFGDANANKAENVSSDDVAAFDALIDDTPEYDLVAKAAL